VVAAFKAKVRSYFGVSAGLPESLIDSSAERLMQNQDDVENTRRDLETDKVFEAIRLQVTVEDKAILSDEFHKIVEAVTAKAQAEQEADAEIRAAQ
jgi:hypothetical protein